LALFNLTIDSKLRVGDAVSLKSGEVSPHRCAVDRATIRHKKIGWPVKPEITG